MYSLIKIMIVCLVTHLMFKQFKQFLLCFDGLFPRFYSLTVRVYASELRQGCFSTANKMLRLVDIIYVNLTLRV